jgi:thiol-disulfide isomerase/thioredoxin
MQNQRTNGELFVKTEAANILLDAAEQIKNVEIARAAVDALADAKPDKPYLQTPLLAVRAKWAELNGHKLDALLIYRAALDARPADFKPRPTGKDEIAENFERLWKELGGTAEGKNLFSKKAKTVEAATEGRWEKPTKELPPWQLPDLDGRTWKLALLHGKVVLINVWASWCGPCRMEHPYLEKLYETSKGNPDLQILTFNIDDEIGAVAPYMKENKYSFPVLLAKDYVNDLLPLVSIPRNWIVDPAGKWQWEQVGFGNDEKWEATVLDKLNKGKSQ